MLDIIELVGLRFARAGDIKQLKASKGQMDVDSWKTAARRPERAFFWFRRGKGVVVLETKMLRYPTDSEQILVLFHNLQNMFGRMIDASNKQLPVEMRKGRRPSRPDLEELVVKVADLYLAERTAKRKAKAANPRATPNINVGWTKIRRKLDFALSDEDWKYVRSGAVNKVRPVTSEDHRQARENFAKSSPI